MFDIDKLIRKLRVGIQRERERKMAKESAQTLMDYLTFTLGKSNTIILLDLSEEVNFDFKHGFSQMLENNTFSGTHEAPIQNLKKFLKISNTVRQNCVLAEYVNLYAFIFSLNGRYGIGLALYQKTTSLYGTNVQMLSYGSISLP